MGKRGAAKRGRIPTSQVPYGYTIAEDGTPQMNQEKAQIVRRIYHRYIHDGMGARAIARQLDEDEAPPPPPPPPRGRRASSGMIRRSSAFCGMRPTRAPGGTARPVMS